MSAVPLVLVVGGAGFGKTTAVSQWLRHDKRSTAWLTASAEHNDPVVLLADLVRVLDEFEPLEPRAKQRLAAVTIDFSSVILPRLEEAVSARGRPFVLVIDDAHRLQRRAVWHLMQTLVESIPAGSQVVLISRTEPELPLGRMRADRRVRTVTIGQLALNRAETGTLFEASGVTLPEHVVDDLWQRTEGWPVAVYLATLAMRDAAPEDLIETAVAVRGRRSAGGRIRPRGIARHPYHAAYVPSSCMCRFSTSLTRMRVTRSWNEMIPHDSWRTPHVRCRS